VPLSGPLYLNLGRANISSRIRYSVCSSERLWSDCSTTILNFRFSTGAQNKGDYKVKTPHGILGVRG